MDGDFGVASQRPNPESSRSSPLLPPRGFVVLHFTLRSVIRFELTFMKSVRSVSTFGFFACGRPALRVQRLIFAPLGCLRLKTLNPVPVCASFPAPAGCPAIQLISDTVYPEVASGSTG